MHKIAKQDKVFVYFQISQKTYDYSTTSKKCPNPCHALVSRGNDGDWRLFPKKFVGGKFCTESTDLFVFHGQQQLFDFFLMTIPMIN